MKKLIVLFTLAGCSPTASLNTPQDLANRIDSLGYINGVQASNQTGTNMDMKPLNGNMIFGSMSAFGNLRANIDEFRLWTKVRSEQEICQDGGGTWQGVDNCVLGGI